MEEELRKNRKRESQKGSANADSLQAASASLQKQPHASGNTTVAGMPPKTSEKQEEELVRTYSKFYPTCPFFHVTSDCMVFLGNDLDAAQLHQSTLPEGQMNTFKRVY